MKIGAQPMPISAWLAIATPCVVAVANTSAPMTAKVIRPGTVRRGP